MIWRIGFTLFRLPAVEYDANGAAALDLSVSRYRRHSRLLVAVLTAAAGSAIVIASFWITLIFLDYRSPTIKELRPTSWKTAGKASYETRDGVVVMRGPDYIYVEIECEVNVCRIEFSTFVERAEIVNIQFVFFDVRGGTLDEPAIKDLSNVRNQMVELTDTAPDLTRKIRLLIYTPKEGEAVAFSNPILRLRPIP
jgi:hypothetical protein